MIGAGIAGLAAAGLLANWFERVVVLERDSLPAEPAPRWGTPQAWHGHGLLVGGQRALDELFPGLGMDLTAAGALPLRVNGDVREERPDHGPMPQRDFGMTGYAMSRPLLEFTLRRRLERHRNVTIRADSRVVGIVTDVDGQRVTGARFMVQDEDRSETLSADLVVDASGRGQPTMALLQSLGRPLPPEETIGIDLGYTTAILPIPADAPSDWKLVLTHPRMPDSTRRAILLPIEGNRWMLTVAGRGHERPPGGWEGLLACLRSLATPTIYRAVRDLAPSDRLMRFGFPGSSWRHFERLETFPDGLVPIGDAICHFNPVYGQGMSVAAKEAVLLNQVLGERATEPDPLAGLGRVFLAAASRLVETPWSMAAIPDFACPGTRGERPADLDQSLAFFSALFRLAERDAAVQRLTVEVWHMLKPISAYRDPELRERVMAEMNELAYA
ncbi:MAG: hypothetical protein WDN25_15385 [Acetobacteraceae bacterium]